MKISIIAGARPNFVKIAPIIHALQKCETEKLRIRLIHTGQHYDEKMSESFFKDLNISQPDINLGVGSGSQAQQTAAIMIEFEKELIKNPADLVMVVGDVTSTMACAIVAKKLNTKVAHVEAGIRSFDLTMPEEINRMVTDAIADYFFTTTALASENLKKNGITDDKIFFVGNVMIDTLMANLNKLTKPQIYDDMNLQEKKYIVLTMHRPANVDETDKLKQSIEEITSSVKGLPVIFPIHPRTAKIFDNAGINHSNLFVTDPMGYLEFNFLVKNSMAVITDSGGITEETTVLGIPCITMRNNTERPETCTIGTNELIGTDPANIKPALQKLFSGNWKKGKIPELWDGNTANRIVKIISEIGKFNY